MKITLVHDKIQFIDANYILCTMLNYSLIFRLKIYCEIPMPFIIKNMSSNLVIGQKVVE